MNIVLATTEYFTENNAGGYGRYIENLASIMADHGHQIYVVTLSDTTGIIDYRSGIRVIRAPFHPLRAHSVVMRLNPIYQVVKRLWEIYGRSYAIYRKIRELSEQIRVDIVQTSNIGGINIIRYKMCPNIVRIAGTPYLNFCAYKYDYNYEKAKKTSLPYRYELSLKRLNKADYIFSSSSFAAKEISKRYSVDIDVIESPYKSVTAIDDSIYKEVLAGSKYFLFFSSLNFLKGIRALAECLERFLLNNPEYHFVFCGNDELLDVLGDKVSSREYILGLARKVTDRIVFLDRIPQKELLFGVIKNSVACVMPSRVDNLPNTCIEAMSLGRIVIGTYGSSFEQLICDGENGLLCAVDNAEDLLLKMNRVTLMNDEERAEMSVKAVETVKRLGPEKIYEQLIELYKKLSKG